VDATPRESRFRAFACRVAAAVGSHAAFLIALAVVLAWAISGPVFGFSDSWQLVINTGTTIVTFLMVFLARCVEGRVRLGELAAQGLSGLGCAEHAFFVQRFPQLQHQGRDLVPGRFLRRSSYRSSSRPAFFPSFRESFLSPRQFLSGEVFRLPCCHFSERLRRLIHYRLSLSCLIGQQITAYINA